MNPPEWLFVAARKNPVASAYLRLWGSSDPTKFFESLAMELLIQNEHLAVIADRALREQQPVIIVPTKQSE